MYVVSQGEAILFTHKDSSSTTRIGMKYSPLFELTLYDSAASTLISLSQGYFQNGRWNCISVVCSDPALENLCKIIPNFLVTIPSATYLNLLFLDN